MKHKRRSNAMAIGLCFAMAVPIYSFHDVAEMVDVVNIINALNIGN